MARADSVFPPRTASQAPAQGVKPARRKSAASGGLRWNGLFILLLLAGLSTLGLFLFAPEWTNLEGRLPVALRSPLYADYSADPLEKRVFAPLSTAILAEALADRERAERPAEDLLATMVDDLRTPVPTITPRPSLTPSPTGDAVLPPKAGTASPTAPAQRTLSVTRTARPTQTVSPEPDLTATATRALPTLIARTPDLPTPTSTLTPLPPVFRPSATSGTINTPLPSRTPENTQAPPTRTPVPPTQPPPTATRPPVQPTQPPAPTEVDPDPYPPPPPPAEETPSYPYP